MPYNISGSVTFSSGGTIDFTNAASTIKNFVTTSAGDTIYASSNNTLTRLALASTLQSLRIVGTAPSWQYNVVPIQEVQFYEEFMGNIPGGDLNWISTVAGTGAANTSAAYVTGNPIGVFQLATGTTTTGSACLSRQITSGIRFAQGNMTAEFAVLIPVLSTVGNAFTLRVGFGDNTAADYANGVYFEYAQATGNFWVTKTAKVGARTANTTNSAVAANTWYRLRITVDTTPTVTFSVNGTNVNTGTIATNVPVATTSLSAPNILIIKSAGTTSVNAMIDYFYFQYTLLSNRY